MRKIYCDFCKKELDESEQGHVLRETAVFHNVWLDLAIEVMPKHSKGERVLPDMCASCLFDFLDLFDPREKKKDGQDHRLQGSEHHSVAKA